MSRPLLNGVLCLGIVLAGVFVIAQEGPNDFEPPTRARRARSEEQRTPISLDGGASINPAVLGKIQDDTLGLTADDREAYFRILKLTEKLHPDELQILANEFREDRHAASAKYRRGPIQKFPAFVDLFQHPDEYRGRPITLHGHFRRLVGFNAGQNEQGFETLYEGWLYPDEGQGHPAVVIFAGLPDGLPLGGDITEEITVTGYFLKTYGYQAQDTTRKAPLILADTVDWRPQRRAAAWTPSPGLYAALTGIVFIVGLMIAFGVRESQQRRREEWQARHPDHPVFVHPDSLAGQSPPVPGSQGVTLEPHH